MCDNNCKLLLIFGAILCLIPFPGHAQTFKFDFGSGAAAPGYTQVTPQTGYSSSQGYGIDKGNVSSGDGEGGDPLQSDYLTTNDELFFSVAVPQGNYDVTVIFGDAAGATSTTVTAENRRLLFDRVTTSPGSIVRKTITVNRRETRSIDGTVTMSIKERERGYYTWDDVLTLRFSGKKPAVCGIEIEKNDNAKTLFLCGNSTVVDQLNAPWCSWGQMIPSFFTPDVVVANYAESGLTAGGFLSMKRLDKIMADAQSGDYVFVEFGHNDQKSSSDVRNYAANLKTYRDRIEAKGAIPIFVTPTARQSENDPRTSIGGLAQEMRETASSLNVTYIDLNRMVIDLHKALGSDTKYLYMHTAGDQTHFSEYGGYELARCVMKGLEEHFPSLKDNFIPEYSTFDPSQPDSLDFLTKDKDPVNVNTFTVTATAEPGGAVDQSPRGKSLAQGTRVIFTAVAAPGWEFAGWAGNYNGSDDGYTVDSLDSDISLTASFIPTDLNNNVYEAESAVMNNSVAESDNSGYSGTGYANFDNEAGSSIDVPVYAPGGGEKIVTVTFANGSADAREISVEVNGSEVISSLSFSGTGDWTTWETKEMKLALEEGINTIRLISVSSDGGPNIDKLEIGGAVSVDRQDNNVGFNVLFDSRTFSVTNSAAGTEFRVEIYSINGRRLFKLKANTGSSTIPLPVNKLNSGCYLIKAVFGNAQQMKKISIHK